MVRATPPIWTKHLYSHSIYYFVWKRLFLFCFQISAAAAAKSLQSCPTLCDPIDGSPAGSPVPGILQARTLEGVAISFSNAWQWTVKVKSLSCVQLFVTPWTAAHQAPPSMGFSRQEYWSRVPLPTLFRYLGVPYSLGSFAVFFFFFHFGQFLNILGNEF